MMSKYEPLWRFLHADGSEKIELSFDRICEILGFQLDHSFLTYKKDCIQYGYQVDRISMKEQWVRFSRTEGNLAR